MKCERFAQVLEDMLTEFEAIKTETLKRSLAVWTTSTMQHLIQSYQYRLQKEVVLFNTSNVVDIYASVHRIEHALTTRLDAALPPRDKTLRPVLENYHPLLPGDLRVIQTNHLAPQDFESCVLYQGEKTWKTFRGEYAEEVLVHNLWFKFCSSLWFAALA
ncbi:hypothetical protein DL96DRAFT_1608421 [Flagelloscypha sp. PMI_526]|nr:hypothetical protein DL96DRAFT_1608421 [Flagelloscypha sp. PMI_526]